jgi:Zn-finger nucleic acid-binding protein
MPEISPLLPCPVCLGITMEKVTIGPRGELQVDHCRRCGGVWLEHGEVQRLRALDESHLWSALRRQVPGFRMRCHDCHALIARADAACPACGWKNTLACPACDRPMLVESHAGLRLDVCRECKGVWFDHHELESIWKDSLDRSVRDRERRTGTAVAEAGDVAGEVLLHSLFFAPDLVFYGARAAGHAAAASAEVVANLPGAIGAAPEVAAAAVEAAGEAASSVFEIIVNIIAGIFDGL